MEPQEEYRRIELVLISPSPNNPRKRFSGQEFDELTASIREKGVLEPVIVRPLNGNGTFELVVGERRFRASLAANLPDIPAVIRNYSDDEAFEVLTIENLQREDLTDYEEASSFKSYIDRRGEEVLPGLAEKIGLDQRYVRRRVRVMALPEAVLKDWESGKLLYGHLEQLLRLPDETAIIEMHKTATQHYIWSVAYTRRAIDARAPNLHGAPFEKTECKKCRHNSASQDKLFGDLAEDKKTRCHNPVCFREKLNAHFAENWVESDLGKKYGTARAVISESPGYNVNDGFVPIYANPNKKCKTCTDLVTIVWTNGEVSNGQACANPSCMRSENSSASRADTDKRKGAENVDSVRDAFFKKRIGKEYAGLDPEDERAVRLLLLACIQVSRGNHINDALTDAAIKAAGIPGPKTYRMASLWRCMEALPIGTVKTLLKDFAGKVILEADFDSGGRRAIGPSLGIDLAKEFKITETYLKWKTIAQILDVGKETGIFEEEKAKRYIAEKFGAKKFEALKKEQLIETILKCGVDLTGKTPREILDGGEE